METTIYVCGKCGEASEHWESLDDWLIASNPNKAGQMVIRCPQCITEYAIRKAGGHLEDGKGVVNNWSYRIN